MSAPDVRAFTVGPVQENCYIVRADAEPTRAVIVDPGDEPERLLAAIDSLGVQIEAILLTHCHFDHIGAVAPVARATGAPVYCPELERPLLADISSGRRPVRAVREPRARAPRQGRRAPQPRRHRVRRAVHARAQPRPRHLRAPIARHPALLSGDVLFQGSVGRVDLPGGDWPTLERSIESLLRAYPADTVVYPGHMGVTTLGRERDSNPFLSELRERVPVARTAGSPAA